MTTSCPYCGATMNLNYCVVCGRQATTSANKMGSLKTVARNTDITKKLEDPLQLKKYRWEQALARITKLAIFALKIIAGGLLIALLIAIVSNQAADLFRMQAAFTPWMKSHRIVFPNQMPLNLKSIENSLTNAVQSTKNKTKPHTEKHKQLK